MALICPIAVLNSVADAACHATKADANVGNVAGVPILGGVGAGVSGVTKVIS